MMEFSECEPNEDTSLDLLAEYEGAIRSGSIAQAKSIQSKERKL